MIMPEEIYVKNETRHPAGVVIGNFSTDKNYGPHKYVPIDQLTAANKAIVALSEALGKLLPDIEHINSLTNKQQVGYGHYLDAKEALTNHAPAIEKARGG